MVEFILIAIFIELIVIAKILINYLWVEFEKQHEKLTEIRAINHSVLCSLDKEYKKEREKGLYNEYAETLRQSEEIKKARNTKKAK